MYFDDLVRVLKTPKSPEEAWLLASAFVYCGFEDHARALYSTRLANELEVDKLLSILSRINFEHSKVRILQRLLKETLNIVTYDYPVDNTGVHQAGTGGRVIIGETMTRIRPLAEKYGARTFEIDGKWPGDFKGMLLNFKWIMEAILKGDEIIDAGLHIGRSKRSSFYLMEKVVSELFSEV